MRILVLTRSTPLHGGGGMERVIWDLMLRWADEGHEVTCVTTPLPGPHDPTLNHGILLVEVGDKSGKYSKAWWAGSAAEASRVEADIIVGCGQGAHRVAINRDSRIPVVMQAHGNGVDEILTKLRVADLRALASLPKALIALVRDLRAYPGYATVISVGTLVTARLGRYPKPLRPSRVITIENEPPRIRSCISRTSARKQLGWSEGERVIVAAGRIHREKGFDLLLKAARMVDDARFVIVGDGSALPGLRARASSGGSSTIIDFVGRQDSDTTRLYLAAASVVVIPSRRYEGAPMVLHESLQVNQRVIISRHNSGPYLREFPEQVTAARANARDIAHAIRQVLESPPPSLPVSHPYEDRMGRYAVVLNGLARREDALGVDPRPHRA